MKIAVWKTGHPIADTAAEALREGFNGEIKHCSEWQRKNTGSLSSGYDYHFAYGILRGTQDIFHGCHSPWFHVDNGYFNPGHFNGYYRISFKGTQAKWHEGIPRKLGEFNLLPIKKRNGYVLICPPTPPVCDFFNINYDEWMRQAFTQLHGHDYRIRTKGMDDLQGHLGNAKAVITFNSSVGWEALRQGIPVISDPEHSVVGTFYKNHDHHMLIESFSSLPDNRLELFEAMNAHQFTLNEIKEGKAWGLINHYLSSSATTAESPHVLMSSPTPLANELLPTLRLSF